jgi:hypothetical protein
LLVHDDPRVRSFASQSLAAHVTLMASWEAQCISRVMTNIDQVANNSDLVDIDRSLNLMRVTAALAVLLGRVATKSSDLEIGATGLADVVRGLGSALVDHSNLSTEERAVQVDRITSRVLHNSSVDPGGNDEEAFVFFAESVLIRATGLYHQGNQAEFENLVNSIETTYHVVGACRSFTSIRRDRSVVHIAQRVQRIHVRLLDLLMSIKNLLLDVEVPTVQAMQPAIARLGSFIADVLRYSCSGAEFDAINAGDTANQYTEQLMKILGDTRLPIAMNLAAHDLVRGIPIKAFLNQTSKSHRSDVFTSEDEVTYEIRPELKQLIFNVPVSVRSVVSKGLKANDVRILLDRHDHSDV